MARADIYVKTTKLIVVSLDSHNLIFSAACLALAAIPGEERLSGQILSEAHTGAQMTDAELEKQVKKQNIINQSMEMMLQFTLGSFNQKSVQL